MCRQKSKALDKLEVVLEKINFDNVATFNLSWDKIDVGGEEINCQLVPVINITFNT